NVPMFRAAVFSTLHSSTEMSQAKIKNIVSDRGFARIEGPHGDLFFHCVPSFVPSSAAAKWRDSEPHRPLAAVDQPDEQDAEEEDEDDKFGDGLEDDESDDDFDDDLDEDEDDLEEDEDGDEEDDEDAGDPV